MTVAEITTLASTYGLLKNRTTDNMRNSEVGYLISYRGFNDDRGIEACNKFFVTVLSELRKKDPQAGGWVSTPEEKAPKDHVPSVFLARVYTPKEREDADIDW